MYLDKMVFVFSGVDVQSTIRYQASFIERILVRMTEGHELVILLKIGELQASRPAHSFERSLEGPLKIIHQIAQLSLGGRLRKTPNGSGDGMDFASAK